MASARDVTPHSRFDANFWERLIGTALSGFVFTGLISSRTIPFTMPAFAILLLLGPWLRREAINHRPGLNRAEIAAAAFVAYALASALWAFKPSGAFVPIVTAAGYLAGYVVLADAIFKQQRSLARRLAEGLCGGLICGLVYLGFEIATDQSIKLFIYRSLHVPKAWLRPTMDFTWNNSELVAIAPTDLKRNIAPISILVWAAIFAMPFVVPGQGVKRLARIGLFALAAFVIMRSAHETSKAALIWSTLVFGVASFSCLWSKRLLQAAWVVACLAIVPLSISLHRADFHNAHWMQDSFRHRIIIWNNTAEETLKRPFFGIGAGMMYQLDPMGERREADEDFTRAAPHAHNVYLQTWFELGAVGALILTIFGLLVIGCVAKLPPRIIPYAHATFAAVMVMIAASYGMWQPWFIAMFALSALSMTIVIRAMGDESAPTPMPQPANDPGAIVS